jgi:hypothetical protein
MSTQLIKDLEFALSLNRPHGGTGVTALCNYIVERVGEGDLSVDFCGNIHVDMRDDSSNKTLFTAHVDTVHRKDGDNTFSYMGDFMLANTTGQPLGADDGAGVALLLHMIDNRVPGYYIFFQGEEKGGIGSSWLALNDPDLVMNFDRAITFDRKGTHSVITHQMCGRTCSDDFAYALSDALNAACDDFMYIPDDGGVYTDTAEFSGMISECTNISVGYFSEHTPNEKLDIAHFNRLANAVLKVNWDSLGFFRDPDEIEEVLNTVSYTSHPTYNSSYDYYSNYGYPSDKDYDLDPVGANDVYVRDEEMALIDALADARYGLKTDLINLIAEYVHPEQPEMAIKFLSRNAITSDVVIDAEEMLSTGYDSTQVIEYLFDVIYKE